ncbi:MAG: D-beta-hydroxybutyrate dehydrogenase [Pseudomonadota bacterium]|jgi:NAD(P)-dependent dehydrogenase (short-subunit alcohol dehydrogenase family)
MSRRVIVTAGANGIGREIVRACVAAGDRVATCDVDAAGLAALRDELPGLATLTCDVGRRADVGQFMQAALGTLGGLDLLVNNAGIGGPTSPVDHYPPQDWDRVLQVNLTGTFDVTRLAIPALRAAGGGSIVLMSSAAGRFGYANRSAYCASKWALVGLAKTLALELGADNIRANAILPGAVDGERLHRVYAGRVEATGQPLEQVLAAAMAGQSLKRFVDPRDIAQLVLFLASEAGKSISGQALNIDNDMQRA